jgi:hypothetical protein
VPDSDATPQALIAAARDLTRVEDQRTAGLWPRAAALLVRQAMEGSMRELWRLRAPGLEATTMRCQLLCLGDFIHDPELAGRLSITWVGLSRVCHVRIYDLAPTLEELDTWLLSAGELADAVADELALAAGAGDGGEIPSKAGGSRQNPARPTRP